MAGSITRKAIIDSYMKLVKTVPFNKITVGDIAEEAGINRQTFYYHFRDIIDLLTESTKEYVLKELDGEDDFSNSMMKLYAIMLRHSSSILNVYHHVEVNEFKHRMNDIILPIATFLVDAASGDIPLSDEDYDIAVKYTTSMTATFIIEWIDKGMYKDPEKFSRFADLLESNMKNTIEFLRS